MASSGNVWSAVTQAPPDAIFGLVAKFKADPDPSKINLTVGVYKDEKLQPKVLDVVKRAEKMLLEDTTLNKNYLPIDGDQGFCSAAKKMLYGDLAGDHIAVVQSLSGTGALSLGAFFTRKFMPASTNILISDPTWGNHRAIFRTAGFPDDRKSLFSFCFSSYLMFRRHAIILVTYNRFYLCRDQDVPLLGCQCKGPGL